MEPQRLWGSFRSSDIPVEKTEAGMEGPVFSPSFGWGGVGLEQDGRIAVERNSFGLCVMLASEMLLPARAVTRWRGHVTS